VSQLPIDGYFPLLGHLTDLTRPVGTLIGEDRKGVERRQTHATSQAVLGRDHACRFKPAGSVYYNPMARCSNAQQSRCASNL
jgi:hypothetical protein